MQGLQILSDAHFVSLITCSAMLVFSISLSGELHRDMEKAVFGFFGLAWMVVVSLAFLLYGALVGFCHIVGSYIFGLLVSPIASLVAGFLRGEFTRRQGRARLRDQGEPPLGRRGGVGEA